MGNERDLNLEVGMRKLEWGMRKAELVRWNAEGEMGKAGGGII